jgi:hypothetical protein
MVVLNYEEGLDAAAEAEFFDLVRNLRSIPGVTEVVCGKDEASQSNQGYQYGFLLRFDSEDAFRAYGPSEPHQRLARFTQPRRFKSIAFSSPMLPENQWAEP